MDSKPVCTNVNPKITGPHFLHTRVGALYSQNQLTGPQLLPNTELETYSIYYELR